MNITLTPDTYTPSVDQNGNYIDYKPVITHGIICPCSSRKDKSYDTASKFSAHIKTKTHQKWLLTLNSNKANYYVELLKYKDTVAQQQKIIVSLDNKLLQKDKTIAYLTNQLVETRVPTTTVTDLLDL